MSLARIKTWIAGEVLTAADLNGEFNNILNNPVTLISPTTGVITFSTAQTFPANQLTPSVPRVLQVQGGSVIGPVSPATTDFSDAAGASIAITPASTNSRISIMYSFNGVLPPVAGANPFYIAQIATSSGSISGTDHALTAPSGAGGVGIDADLSWSILVSASTGPYPTTYKIQHLQSTAGAGTSLNKFYGILTEYSS